MTPTLKRTFKQNIDDMVKEGNSCSAAMLVEISMTPSDKRCNDKLPIKNKKFTAYNEKKEKMTFMKETSFTSNGDGNKYEFGFHVTVRYSKGLDKCLVYRTNTKDYGGDKNAKIKGEFNNIFSVGSIDDLILTYRPPKKFDTGDKEGEMSTFEAKSRYCVEAITSKWTDKSADAFKSIVYDDAFSYYKLEGALIARFVD